VSAAAAPRHVLASPDMEPRTTPRGMETLNGFTRLLTISGKAYRQRLRGSRERTNKWWFRLDEPHLDGEIIIPTGKNNERICREYPVQE